LKILICAGYYTPHIGGYPKNVHELAKRLVERGHEAHVLTCDTEGVGDGVVDNVAVMRLPSWHLAHNTLPVPKPTRDLLYNLVKKGDEDYDVVINQARIFPISLWGVLYAKIHHIPLIHVERGSYHCPSQNWLPNVVMRIFDHTVGSWMIKSATARVGVSQAVCSFLEHLGGRNPLCIHNGITPAWRSRVQSKGKNICFIGRLIYAKGVQDLIAAFAECTKKRNSLCMTIVGDGEYRKELEKLAVGLPVAFLGEIQNERVLQLLLSQSYLFVNPSYSEGLPTSVMEAAVVGLPIIATDVGGTREIITHGVSGLLYQPHDTEQLTRYMVELIDNENEAALLGSITAERVVQEFSWDGIVEQYDELLKEVTKEKENNGLP